MSNPVWNSATTYPVNSVVSYSGYLWRAIQTNTNEQPARGSLYWGIVGLGSTAGGVSSIAGGIGISVSGGTNVTVQNVGVIDMSAGTGISVSHDASNNYTINNTGTAFTAGVGIDVSDQLLSNTGVLSFTNTEDFVLSTLTPPQQAGFVYASPFPSNSTTYVSVSNYALVSAVDSTYQSLIGSDPIGNPTLLQKSAGIILTISMGVLYQSYNGIPYTIRVRGNNSQLNYSIAQGFLGLGSPYQSSGAPAVVFFTNTLFLKPGVHYQYGVDTGFTIEGYAVLQVGIEFLSWNYNGNANNYCLQAIF